MTIKSKNIFIIGTRCFGISKSRLPQIDFFNQNGYQVYVLADKDSTSKILEEHGAIIINVSFLILGLIPSSKAIKLLCKYHLKYKPELTVVYNSYPILINSIACFFQKRTVINVFTGTGAYIQFKRAKLFLTKLIFRLFVKDRSTVQVAQNKEDQEFLKHFLNVKSVKLIQSSGVDVNYFNPSKYENDVVNVLCLTRILPNKGVLEYLKSVINISKEHKKIRFLLGGEFDKQKLNLEFVKKIEELITKSNVNFIGFSNDVRGLLESIDIFVYPSYYPEGVPRICLEAASMEIPIITTTSRGCNVTVRNGESGYAIPPRSIDELTIKLKVLIENEDQRISMGKAARFYMKEEFSSEKISAQYFKLFEQYLNDK